jgi:RNA polymerase sigma-70 factor (ECF subfamily)
MSETATAVLPSAMTRTPPLDVEALWRSCADDLHAYACTVVRDPSAAEEVVAVTFERALRRRGRFDPRRGEPRAWIFGIARNAAVDELRRRGRGAELTHDPPDVATGDHADDLADRDEAAHRAAIVARAIVFARCQSPESNAGRPQQCCAVGTTTSAPHACMIRTVASAIAG